MDNSDFEKWIIIVTFLNKLQTLLRNFGFPQQRKNLPAEKDEIREALQERGPALIREQTELLKEQVRSGELTVDEQGNPVPLPEVKNGLDSLFTSAGIDTKEHPELQAALLDVVLRENRQAKRVQQIVVKAIDHANATPEEGVSDEPVDPDWATRWHHWAKDVSNDEVQEYWAKILAGEIKRPGSFSLHTLDLLSRMSRADVELTDRAAKLRIDDSTDAFIFCGTWWGDQFLRQFGLTYHDILTLSELSIMNSTEGLASKITLEANSQQWLFRLHNKVVGVACDDKETVLDVRHFKLTRAGKELCSLGAGYKVNEAYLQAFAESLKKNDVTVAFGDLQPNPDQPGNFHVLNPVEV